MPVISAGVTSTSTGRVGSTTGGASRVRSSSRCRARAARDRASSSPFSSAAAIASRPRSVGTRMAVGGRRQADDLHVLLAAQPAPAELPGQQSWRRAQPRCVVTAQPDPCDRSGAEWIDPLAAEPAEADGRLLDVEAHAEQHDRADQRAQDDDPAQSGDHPPDGVGHQEQPAGDGGGASQESEDGQDQEARERAGETDAGDRRDAVGHRLRPSR